MVQMRYGVTRVLVRYGEREMKIEYRECIDKLIEALAIDRKENKMCFFKHYSSFELYANEIAMLIDRYSMECKYKFHEFAGNVIQDAYSPFMDLIRELYTEYYSKTDIKKFLEACNVYPVQRDMFECYIKEGRCMRAEDIIPKEVNYERERFIDSVIRILEYVLLEHKVVLVLRKLHLAQESTLQLLKELVWNRKIPNMVLICVYNESFNVSSYMLDEWQQFKEKMDNSEYVIKCDDDEDESGNTDIIEAFEPDATEIPLYTRKLNDMMYTLAFEQAAYYFEHIYHAIEIDKMGVSQEMRVRILLMYAMATFYMGQSKRAYVLCKKVQDSDYLYQDIDCQYTYNYILTLVLLYSGQRKEALDVVDKAKHMAKTMDDEEKVLKVDMLNILVLLNGCQDTFVWDASMEIPTGILETAEKNNQKNHLAYAYLFGFIDLEIRNNSILDAIEYDKSDYFVKGIQIAKEIDNIELQLLAWQKNGVVASSAGKFEQIISYYGKCKEIIEGLDRPWDEIQIDNGIGYSCIINERYEMANDYFSKALRNSYKIEEPLMIMEVLYNMSVNGIALGDYVSVENNIATVLRMMSIIKLQRIRTCNKSKLYGMLIFAYIKLDKIYDAKLYFDKMKTELKMFLEDETESVDGWEDDLFLYNVVKGMLDKVDERYRDARESFVQARFIWNKARSKQEYLYARFIEEESVLYEILGEEDKRKKTLEDGISFCQKIKLHKNTEYLKKLLKKQKMQKKKYPQILTDSDLETLIKTVSVYGLKQELKNKNKVLNFFENWVEALNQDCDSEEELIYGAMNMLQNTFNIDNLMYIDVINEEPNIKYKDKNMDFNQVQARFLLDYMKRNRKKIIISRFEKSFSIHEELVSIFAKNSITSMIVIPFMKKDKIIGIFVTLSGKYANFTENVNIFTEEDANIFRTAFRELLEAINREKIKKQLERSSVTDTLTGLNNRQGMKQYFEEQFKNWNEFKHTSVKNQFTILYLDLDNFKYCNDHFGHDVGDAVIVAFSRMLEKVVGKNDCVVRYGGDEFLVILNNKTEEDGSCVAERIFETLEKNEGFKTTIEKVYKKGINIPKIHRVSCSIGISTGKTSVLSGINKILKRADDALYHVKKTTKHDYYVWRKME